VVWKVYLGLALPLMLVFGLGILRAYLADHGAMRRGYGQGRSTLGWLLMGFSGASPLALFRTGPKPAEIETETLPCPRCRESRRFYKGFCTVCGCEVIAALIAEARGAEGPISNAEKAPAEEAGRLEDWQRVHTLGEEPEPAGRAPRVNL
jgi:hypothetical protein